jgi:GNAT superfamily N-acetyltransferase
MIRILRTDIYDIKKYSDHLKSLPDHDKISRFGIKISDFSIDQLMLTLTYNPDDHELFKALLPSDEIVGWGHMARDSNSWELAVSVENAYQRKGVGGALIKEMLEWAKFNHIEKVFMHCIEDNKIIQHLASKHRLVTKERVAGERTAAIELPDPSWMDINSQLWKEYSKIFDEFAELRRKTTKLMLGNTNT